jgi:hypothetical protein
MEDRRFSPILLSLLLFFATSAGLFAQQPSKESFDAPVVLTRVVTYPEPHPEVQKGYLEDVTKQELAQDFGPDNFQVQVGGVAAQVESVLIEKGPKRVVLVLDASKPVPKDEYDENIYVAKALLGYARSKDRFKVLLVGSDAPTAKFISPSETKRYLGELRAARPPTTEPGTRIYDTLLTAAKNLDPPQFGDVVILFGRLEDSGSKATMEDLSGAFVREKLRFFGVSFAPSPPPPALERLSAATGYSILLEPMRDGRILGIWEPDFEFWYAWIAEPYRLRVSLPALGRQDLIEIKLVPGLKKKKTEGIELHFPRIVYPLN